MRCDGGYWLARSFVTVLLSLVLAVVISYLNVEGSCFMSPNSLIAYATQ